MSLLHMSFSASILILVIVVIRALFLHKLPKRTFPILWGVVLCRLLIPFEFSSRFSIYSIVNTLTGGAFEIDVPLAGIPIVQNNAAIAEVNTTAPEVMYANISPFMIIWLIGLGSCALFFLVTHLRCCKEYKTTLPVDNELVKLWQQTHPMRRRVQIRKSDRIAAPLTYGIFQPVVLLPKQTDWTDETRLRYILAHEFVHIRRFDTLTKLVMATAICVHWCNPFVWLMYVLSNRDIELSCDETVVRMFGGTVQSAYALTLIGLEEKKSHFMPLVNNFSKNAMEERITAIMKIKKVTLIRAGTALFLVLGIVIIFATSKTAQYTQLPQGAFAEEFAGYSSFGIEYVGNEYDPEIPGSGRGNLYFNGQLVKQFVDTKDTHDILTYDSKEGDGITVQTIYDEKGKLIGVEKK